MDKEKAVAIEFANCLKNNYTVNFDDMSDFCDEVIEALENSCEDSVSKQQVLDIVKFEEKWLKDAKGNNPNTDIAFSGIMAKVAKLPLVTPNTAPDYESDHEAMMMAKKALEQEPKKGHWKLVQRGKCIDVCCSNCKAVRIKEYAYNYTIDQLDKEDVEECLESHDMRYCPYCGSDNREVEE